MSWSSLGGRDGNAAVPGPGAVYTRRSTLSANVNVQLQVSAGQSLATSGVAGARSRADNFRVGCLATRRRNERTTVGPTRPATANEPAHGAFKYSLQRYGTYR
jgi:hypothetical protein